MTISAYRTVTWRAPVRSFIAPQVLAWPDRYLGDATVHAFDLGAYTRDGDGYIAQATATAGALTLGPIDIAGDTLALQIAGGLAGTDAVTFTLVMGDGAVAHFVVGVRTLASAIAGTGTAVLDPGAIANDYGVVLTDDYGNQLVVG